MTSLVWFRLDLRLADNPALQAAVLGGDRVVPVFIWAPEEEEPWAPGAAARWWLHQSLKSLQGGLKARGSRLIIRQGPTLRALRALAAETGAERVLWNRLYEPAVVPRDEAVKKALSAEGLKVESFNGSLLFEPWAVKNQSGKPFQVFTPFWNACRELPAPPLPADAPERLAKPRRWPESSALADLGLEPELDWAAGLRQAWTPGEAGAIKELQRFLKASLASYPAERDRPDLPGTSRLSPHLHFGEIGPRQVWHSVASFSARHGIIRASEACLRQITWREFAHHLLFHHPHTAEKPLRREFVAFPWRAAGGKLNAWQRGRTGYPLVDAGMRELWQTGWMHNRVRMVAASFLVKDLLIHWRKGADWFWDTLVDADLANNTFGWQWTAGCGADAAPYFRIFNPVTQGEKFDPTGDYVRRWVPELARLPVKWIHKPWMAPPPILEAAGVEIGKTYPAPIVDHALAREEALAALAIIKE